MPRLSPFLLQKLSRTQSPLLPILLRETREVHAAVNELRWLREHVDELIPIPETSAPLGDAYIRDVHVRRNELLKQLCIRRGKWSEPLQYILGKEYFGPSGVEIKVGRGVLVPRPETADLVSHFANLYLAHFKAQFSTGRDNEKPKCGLRVLDLCTGSGCIPILLHSLLYPPRGSMTQGGKRGLPIASKILGVDVSHRAISLARENLHFNVGPSVGSVDPSALREGGVHFIQGDVLMPSSWARVASEFFRAEGNLSDYPEVDLVISNPPYISPTEYFSSTARSVRRWEPKLALVPPRILPEEALGDDFYPQIARIARHLFKSKAVLVEVGGDTGQAERVREIFAEVWGGRENTAVWRDWGGRGRGVVAWRDGKDGWDWLREDMVKT